MTDKITLATVGSLQDTTTAATTINNNFAAIQAALDIPLWRDGTSPNQMNSNLDMNSNQILNLPPPATVDSPVRLIDVTSNPTITVPPVGTSGAVVGLLNTSKTDSGDNTFTGSNTFSGASNTFTNITLPANSAGTSQISANAITNAKLAQAPALTIKGNNTGSTANEADLTVAQVQTMLGLGWTNTGISKTSAYTVQTSDNGGTLILSGTAFYTLTFGVVSGYPSNFVVKVVNTDTRGKLIAANGQASFILWPGQTTFVHSLGGSAWSSTSPGRYRANSIQLFVDVANGNDANDGLATGTGAFQSIGQACQVLYQQIDCDNGPPTINVAPGTYGESVTVSGQLTGYNFFKIVGATSTSVTWRPLSNFCLLIGDDAECQLQGIKFDNIGGATGAVAVSFHQTSVCDFLADINFGNFGGGSHINNDKGGYINLPASYTISGGCNTHISVSSGSIVTQAGGGSVTVINNPSITLMYQALLNSVINFNGTVTYNLVSSPLTGTQKYSLDFLSAFISNGSSIPGSVAGSAGHNSVFV